MSGVKILIGWRLVRGVRNQDPDKVKVGQGCPESRS